MTADDLTEALGADVVVHVGTADPLALRSWFDQRQRVIRGLVRQGTTPARPYVCGECGVRFIRKFGGTWLPGCSCNDRPECVFCADMDGTVQMRPVTKKTQAMLCARCGEDELALTALAREEDG